MPSYSKYLNDDELEDDAEYQYSTMNRYIDDHEEPEDYDDVPEFPTGVGRAQLS